MMSVHVDPSPSHTSHASTIFPLFGTPSQPVQVELVPLHTSVVSCLREMIKTTWDV